MSKHIGHPLQVSSKVWGRGLRVKLSKCKFAKGRIKVLLYIIDSNDLKAESRKDLCVANTQLPETTKELRAFLMFFSLDRRFLPDFLV